MSTHAIAYRGLCVSALAAMNREYLPVITEHVNDSSITEGTLIQAPVTNVKEEAWMDTVLKGSSTDVVFAVLYADPAVPGSEYRYVGNAAIHRITYPSAFGITGSILFDKALHGSGCGTEAKLLLLHHAFHVMGLRKLSSEVKAFNGNSLGHLLKCGYQIIGRRKQHHFYAGGYIDELLLEVFREDFEPIWHQYQELKALPKLSDEQRRLMKRVLDKKR